MGVHQLFFQNILLSLNLHHFLLDILVAQKLEVKISYFLLVFLFLNSYLEDI